VVAPAEIKHLNKLSATLDSVSHGGGILRVISGFHKSGADEGVEITKKHTPKVKLKSLYIYRKEVKISWIFTASTSFFYEETCLPSSARTGMNN
jgi:hypothetical protein